MQKCINRQGLVKSVVENLTFPPSGEIFFIGVISMKHYKGKTPIRDEELINLMEERDRIEVGTEVTYKQYIYKVKKIKGNKVVWDRILKCDRCVWAKWTGDRYYCLFPVCIK